MWGLISWFAISLIMSVVALWAVWARNISRWRLATLSGFLFSILISGASILLSQGWSTPCSLLLPGKYSLLTYQIIPYDRIYLFLDTAYGPKSCYIPWSVSKAEQLDKAEGNTFDFNIQWSFGFGTPGESGPIGPSVEGEFTKRPERPEHPTKPKEEGATF